MVGHLTTFLCHVVHSMEKYGTDGELYKTAFVEMICSAYVVCIPYGFILFLNKTNFAWPLFRAFPYLSKKNNFLILCRHRRRNEIESNYDT